MIKSLKIENFQTHKRRRIKFEKITSIVGSTDTGKSAIIRALRWALLNQPNGNDFIRWGAKEARVQVDIGEATVKRTRGKTKNLYELDEEEYKAFGSSVPDSIQKTCAVTDLNFQAQMDAPFWFSLSNGEVSRQLNAVVDLGIMDDALSKAANLLRKARWEQEQREKDLEAAKKECLALKWIKDCKPEFDKLEKLRSVHVHKLDDVLHLAQLIEKGRKAETNNKKAEALLYGLRIVLGKCKATKEVEDKKKELCNLIKRAHDAAHDAKQPPSFSKCKKLFALLCDKSHLRKKLQSLIVGYDMLINKIDMNEKKAQQASQQFKKETKGKKCPTCGNLM